MARKQNDDLLIEDELAAAFLNDDSLADDPVAAAPQQPTDDNAAWEESEDDFPGQLAVDVYETEELLIVKARTAGVNKEDLDVSISDGILTISGTLSSGDDAVATNWHIQECYWGEFSRTLALPVQVKEDEVAAASYTFAAALNELLLADDSLKHDLIGDFNQTAMSDNYCAREEALLILALRCCLTINTGSSVTVLSVDTSEIKFEDTQILYVESEFD